MSAFTMPLVALAVEGEVVLTGEGAFCGSWTAQAVLASLEPMRKAAEEAISDREQVLKLF